MIVACVRTGTRYPLEYVERLRAMVARHMPPIAYDFVCMTDRPDAVDGVRNIDVPAGLPGWWAKLALFRSGWRAGHRAIYFDLDTVICGDLSPLVAVKVEFATCANFTRAAGNDKWPCKYGSCIMVLDRSFDDAIWQRFIKRHKALMQENETFGDQRVIELLYPNATLLQDVLPQGYMISYRDLKPGGPGRASIVNFGGQNKPHTSKVKWVAEAWR